MASFSPVIAKDLLGEKSIKDRSMTSPIIEDFVKNKPHSEVRAYDKSRIKFIVVNGGEKSLDEQWFYEGHIVPSGFKFICQNDGVGFLIHRDEDGKFSARELMRGDGGEVVLGEATENKTSYAALYGEMIKQRSIALFLKNLRLQIHLGDQLLAHGYDPEASDRADIKSFFSNLENERNKLMEKNAAALLVKSKSSKKRTSSKASLPLNAAKQHEAAEDVLNTERNEDSTEPLPAAEKNAVQLYARKTVPIAIHEAMLKELRMLQQENRRLAKMVRVHGLNHPVPAPTHEEEKLHGAHTEAASPVLLNIFDDSTSWAKPTNGYNEENYQELDSFGSDNYVDSSSLSVFPTSPTN